MARTTMTAKQLESLVYATETIRGNTDRTVSEVAEVLHKVDRNSWARATVAEHLREAGFETHEIREIMHDLREIFHADEEN